MRSIFARFARPSRRRGVRRREVFSAHFDGGQSAAAVSTSIHLGCDVLERRIVLTASPAEDFVFSQGTITGYQGDGGVVEIPSSINGVRVAVIGDNAFRNNATITSVVIPSSVTSIGYQAFSDARLTSVTIANAKTSIGAYAFSENYRLATVSLGNGVTSIGISAFADAKALTAVTIPRTVTSIGIYAFNGCNALKTVRFLGNAPSVGTNAFAGVAAGAKAIRAAALTGYGDYGTIWNNLIVAPSGRVAAPTVTVSTASLPQNAATMTIKGKGFVAGVPSANTMTFDNGAVGTVTAATTRTLTVSITTPPSQSGPLMATVTTNIGGSSGAPKQVATVIPAP